MVFLPLQHAITLRYVVSPAFEAVVFERLEDGWLLALRMAFISFTL